MFFHCVSGQFLGDYLLPLTKIEHDGQVGSFLFSTTNMALAATYAIPNGLKNYCIPNSDGAVDLLIQRQTLALEHDLSATLFGLPENSFEPLRGVAEQFISAVGVHRDQTVEITKIRSFEEMMALGVRIYVPLENVDEFAEIEPGTPFERLLDDLKVKRVLYGETQESRPRSKHGHEPS